MKAAALLLALTVFATTAVAVAGAVKSLMAIHREEIELLHLMGASDSYITGQFRRHIFSLSLRGGIAGVAGSGLIVVLLSLVLGDGAGILPHIGLSAMEAATLAMTIAPVCVLSVLAAHGTALRTLARMT